MALKSRLTNLRARRKELEGRASFHSQILRDKDKQIQVFHFKVDLISQILQDELLTTGISLTVLEERATKLEEENKSLLERWLYRMKLDAEKMNEANEFLEHIRSMKL